MANPSRLEISVGVFVALGLAIVAYLAVSLGNVRILAGDQTTLVARFSSIGDLRKAAPVRIAGVSVGKVGKIELADYVARIELLIDADVKIPSDTIASIRTSGLLGESFVSLSPGGSERMLRDGDAIVQTEPALDITQLLQKYAFGSATEPPPATDEGRGRPGPGLDDPLR
ncbi:MAG TPA: outer membrane lipid asymmetry maintenance protein MlaD [Kofleriaceae bacterium]|nr:outer membrane lipid asymmetry maintenance protein MlaD [Kofleriaceae bacterium]